MASLVTVLLLLPGCDDSDNIAADTMLAETPTTAAPTTADAGEPFDFSTQSLCEWFSPEEIDEIVTSTYEDLGVRLDPSDEMDQRQDENSDCFWASPLVSLAHEEEFGPSNPFVPHPALDESVRVSTEADGSYGLTDGTDAFLMVDGQDERLRFGHTTPGSIDNDVEMINTVGLTIANKMLQQMGWVDRN
jgi:hypothetical protein